MNKAIFAPTLPLHADRQGQGRSLCLAGPGCPSARQEDVSTRAALHPFLTHIHCAFDSLVTWHAGWQENAL